LNCIGDAAVAAKREAMFSDVNEAAESKTGRPVLCRAGFRLRRRCDTPLGELWQRRSEIALRSIALRVLAVLGGCFALSMRPRCAIEAESLIARRRPRSERNRSLASGTGA